MKIIDLLNKIANGEEVPKKIEYRNIKFLYDKNNKLYIVENYNEYNDLLMELSNHKGTDLNYEVEIIEEEKKIPLKINKIVPSQNYVISDSKNNSVDERLEIIRKRLYANELYMLDIANTLNEIIDYFKSKGDE